MQPASLETAQQIPMAQPKKKYRQTQNSAKKPPTAFSGNHQRSWLWGHHAVLETLQSGLWPVLEIYASRDAFNESVELLSAKQQLGIPVDVVTSDRLFEISKSTEHQGLVVRLGPYPYRSLQSFESELSVAVASYRSNLASVPTAEPALGRTPPLVVICDQIQDTFNFGAILRCCDGAGVLGVIVGQRAQAEVTPHVARSSVGAVNYVPVIQTEKLVNAAKMVKSLGFQLVGADGNTKQSAWGGSLKSLTALVIGSEATGISTELLEECDQRLCIPMQGHVTSLNAAVAAGILLFEIRRQQNALST
jgi:23S rRNA (guanosine2251-2'-O)-methyltransferase